MNHEDNSEAKYFFILSILPVVDLTGLCGSALAMAQQNAPGDPAVALGKLNRQGTLDLPITGRCSTRPCYISETKDGEYYITAADGGLYLLGSP
jgi:hypothetical protein